MRRISTVLAVSMALCCWSWQAAADPDGSDFPAPGEYTEETEQGDQQESDKAVNEPSVSNDEIPEPGEFVQEPRNEAANPKDGDSRFPDYQGTPLPGASPDGSGELSKEAVDAVWSIADKNRDGHATDREIFDARRSVRRLANSKKPSTVRDELLKKFDANGNGQLENDEAVACLAGVRGMRCPIAARARAYWESLDTDNDAAVEPEEFRAVLAPLGNVGRAMVGMLDGTMDAIDRDDNLRVDELEVNRRANAMLLIKLATTGDRIAQRNPAQWIQYVHAAANFDIDSDNGISPQEALAHGGLAKLYGRIDRNRDRSITVTELYDYKDHLNAVAAAYARAVTAAKFSSGGC